MTGDEVDRLVDDHYAGEAQCLRWQLSRVLLKLVERMRAPARRASRSG